MHEDNEANSTSIKEMDSLRFKKKNNNVSI